MATGARIVAPRGLQCIGSVIELKAGGGDTGYDT